ncbi:MAG TPA: cobalamin-binding protein [Pyrinomonadaceae bacterium]|nr:cobalamin-binding protein [Pyrinomonadaceae bacterium]
MTFDICHLSFGIATLLIAVLVLLSACSQRHNQKNISTAAIHEVTDEAGRHLIIPEKIDRIVSLAPNLTEIVYAIGAGDRLVGDTTYCDYPEAAQRVEKVGDTMKPSIERIIALKPQIVLVSTASQLETFTNQLEQQHIAVYVTNPKDLDGVFQSIINLGALFERSDQAAKLVRDLQARATATENAVKDAKRVTVFFQLSDQPLYTIGRDAFQTDLIRRAGGISVTADLPTAFPTFNDEAALASKPETIILPVTATGGNSTVAAALQNSPAVQNNRVYRISEDHLSRPGPRLVDGLQEMARDLHPEAFE